MSRTQSTELDLARDHGRSMIVLEHIQTAVEKVSKSEVAGFPWQFAAVMTVIVLGIVVVVLKGPG